MDLVPVFLDRTPCSPSSVRAATSQYNKNEQLLMLIAKSHSSPDSWYLVRAWEKLYLLEQTCQILSPDSLRFSVRPFQSHDHVFPRLAAASHADAGGRLAGVWSAHAQRSHKLSRRAGITNTLLTTVIALSSTRQVATCMNDDSAVPGPDWSRARADSCNSSIIFFLDGKSLSNIGTEQVRPCTASVNSFFQT